MGEEAEPEEAEPEEAEPEEVVPVQFHQKTVTFSEIESMSYEQKKNFAERNHGFTEIGYDEDMEDTHAAIDVAQRLLWAVGSDIDLKENDEEEEDNEVEAKERA